MTLRQLYAGPQYPALETAAFDRLSSTVADVPRSLLYVARTDHAERRTRDRWCDHGAPLSLSVETFDSIVGDCYERERFAGSNTYVDQPLRDRIVELAVEKLDDPRNPLAVPDRMPSAGLCQQVEDLLSLVEFADLHSPAAVRERLESLGLDVQADVVSAVTAAFESSRAEMGLSARRTLRAERYHHVLTSVTPLAESLPSVDAVVLGGFTLFSPLERRLVERLAETWPTVALLPQLTDSTTPVGVDRGAERAMRAYHDLGFEREYVDVDETPGLDVARRLYRPTTAAETDPAPPEGRLAVRSPETVPQELRYVARDVQDRLSEGTPAEEIGVVLADPQTYHERLVETFDQYDVPATLALERSFGDTALGEVVAELVALSRAEPTLESVTALLSNPLVTRVGDGRRVDRAELARVAERLTSRRLTTVYNHLDGDDASAIQSLVDDAAALRDASLTALPKRVDALLTRLGVPDAVERLPETPRGRTERRAMNRLERTLETLALTDAVADLDRADPIDRLERALTGVTVDATTGREDGHVLVCGLDEAAPREFDRAYVLGLTMGGFPSNPDRLAFTRPINEAHEDFEQADVQRGARYDLGLLLASDASLTLSVPERDLGGDPYVEADVVTELRRVADVDVERVDHTDTRPGCREDVQRSLARTFAHGGVEAYDSYIDDAASVGAFDESRRDRLRRGVACAAARASPELTAYDGQLSPETVATLHGPDEREPYSPSRLETYATCGFKYYVDRVLGIDEPEELGLEPDARERGGFVHDVLERYYADLQTAPGDPLDVRGDRDAREAHLLDVALGCLDERFDDASSPPTAFQREWLTKVFAGLGTPAENPHYGDDGFGSPERGLLVRFLDHEFDEVSNATARPGWFEARVGEPYGDETVLCEDPVAVDTPDGTVPLTGMVDRVDVVTDTEPTQVVVRDYKTGRTPSEADTLSGLALQLPLYALLAEDVLDAVETVGGSYYQVKPPTGVNHCRGLVGSQQHASYYKTENADTPLLRFHNPAFESHDAFRRFVERETPTRLGRLAAGIAAGHYQPTVLDPSTAGCRHCGYSDVCDVRPHRRQAVVDGIDDGGVDAYVPLAARDVDPADVLEVE